jgi:tetratricopeptide (TPR) repeat protein
MPSAADSGLPSHVRSWGIKILAATLVAVSIVCALSFAQNPTSAFNQQRAQYSAQVSKTYNYHFGQNAPFQPSNAQIQGGEFIQPGSFPTAAYCGHCHQAAYDQWKQSLHRNSFRAPFYTKNVNVLADTKGVEYTRHCEGCHNPIALFSGAVTKDSHVDRGFDDDGLTCSVCHSIQKIQSAPYGTGSYVMGIPAVMVDAKGSPITGIPSDAEILAHPAQHSKAVMKDFYRTAEFCATCHISVIPRSLSNYKWLRGFSTYDEWQASAFSKRSPLPFYQRTETSCQDCHMSRENVTQSEYGAKKGTLASHRWLGGNTAVPFYYGMDDQVRRTEEFLKNQTLNVDIFALKKVSTGEVVAPLGNSKFNLTASETVQAFVVIQNRGVGHSLIPEQRDFYEAWVEFVAKDSDGREIFHSGFLKPDGSLDESAHSFTSRLLGKDGQILGQHEIWERRAVGFDNTIQSGRSTLVRYEFHIPAGAKGPLTITARVNYRHFNQPYLDYVLGPGHPAYPVVEMAARTRSLNLGENGALAAEAQDNPEWQRWNNYGIALFDQQQFADAQDAFEHVVKLRPDYADGYTNLAATDLNWDKYSLAREFADKALSLSPGNARALYYRALAERNQSTTSAAIADLEQVVKKFPLSRDAHRELGVSYYLAHRDDAARSQFEAVQGIYPDDVLCHYYLAIVYRRLGMNAKSDEQNALYTEKKDDPEAPTLILAFLRAHPESDDEGMGSHVHLDGQSTTPSSKPKK